MGRRLHAILALLIAGALGVVIPLHHHDDGETDHHECALCVLQAIAVVPAVAPSLAAATSCRLISALLSPAPLYTAHVALYEARAPPLLPV